MSKVKTTKVAQTTKDNKLKASQGPCCPDVVPTVPFVTAQCGSGTICFPEWTIAKTASPLGCVMIGQQASVDYTITVSRVQTSPNLCWSVNYTIHNPTSQSVEVNPMIQLLQNGVPVGPLVPVSPTPIKVPAASGGSFGIATETTLGCTPFTGDCTNGGFSLDVALFDTNLPPNQILGPNCTTTNIPITVNCTPEPEYCLYDNSNSSGVSGTSCIFNSVTGSDNLAGTFPQGSQVKFPTPIPITNGDFSVNGAATTQIVFDFTCTFTVVGPCDAGICICDIASLATPTSGICPDDLNVCNVVAQASQSLQPSCQTPVCTLDVTNQCVPSVCLCKTSTVTPPCEQQSCASLFDQFNTTFSGANPPLQSFIGNGAPGAPVDGIIPYVDISIVGPPGSALATANPSPNGYAGWCLDIYDTFKPGQQYDNIEAISLSDPEAGALLTLFFARCAPGQAITVSYLIGILQILNNAAAYEAGGFTFGDIQTAIWTLLFGNPLLPFNFVNDGLQFTETNVITILSDAIAAQNRYNISVGDQGARVCAALHPNNLVGGIILLDPVNCTQVLLLQVPLCALLGVCQPSQVTVTFFGTANCNTSLGPTANYQDAAGRVIVPLAGFAKSPPSTPDALFEKCSSPEESGIGFGDNPSGDNEIDAQHFVRVDLASLFANAVPGSDLLITLGSMQTNENANLYLHTKGSPGDGSQITDYGTPILLTATSILTTFQIPYGVWSGADFLAISANNDLVPTADVLLHSLSITVCNPVIAPPSINYSVSFTATETCKTCATFSLNNLCDGATPTFTLSVAVNCPDCGAPGSTCSFTEISSGTYTPDSTGFQTVCIPQSSLPEGANCLQVAFTITPSGGTSFAGPVCTAPIPAFGPTVNICLQDCLSVTCITPQERRCATCEQTQKVQIVPPPAPAPGSACTAADYGNILALLNQLFGAAVAPGSVSLGDLATLPGCAGPAVQVQTLLSSLVNCGLNFSLVFLPDTTNSCCGLCLRVQNNLSLLVGGNADCSVPAAGSCVSYSEQSFSLTDTIQFPACSTTPSPKPAPQKKLITSTEKKKDVKKEVKKDQEKPKAKGPEIKVLDKSQPSIVRRIVKQ